MRIGELEADWDHLARLDPLWATVQDPSKRGGGWAPDSFFATGVEDVRSLLGRAAELGIAPIPGRALDFGCGVGRLTQALGDSFREVDGLDISPVMIQVAERYNRHRGRCRYQAHAANGLPFPDRSFDFVCAMGVLQLLERSQIRACLREFARVLRPGGLLIFNVPSRPSHWKTALKYYAMRLLPPLWSAYRRYRAHALGHPIIETHGVRPKDVERTVAPAGLRIAGVDDHGKMPGWQDLRYYAVKRA